MIHDDPAGAERRQPIARLVGEEAPAPVMEDARPELARVGDVGREERRGRAAVAPSAQPSYAQIASTFAFDALAGSNS